MKTMKKFLSMAALAMVGAMTVGCTNEDNVIDQAQTATKNNVVTQTVTVGFDEQAATRALAIDYTNKKLTKTFKADDQIAVIYQNASDELVKATVTIAAGDISTNGKSAKFTVTMANPKASGTLKYIYPAAMAGATDVDYTKLNSQDGTLASLAANLDLAVFEGTLTAEKALPASATLENKLAILALTIKNSGGTDDLTSTITGMTLSDGTNSYSITGKDDDGHIYAAIQATSGANISCFATTASGNYAKSLTGKTYVANNIYNLGLKMDDATTVGLGDATTDPIVNGSTLSGLLTSNVKISIADGAIVTLKGVTINNNGWTDGDYAGITCEGSATIILEGENTVKGVNASYPGIYVPEGKTLTIMGSGSLNASSNGSGSGAGIGGGENGTCGNIVIKGGEITATGGANGGAGIGGASNGTCGNITISGGTITATGGTNGGAGIGGGSEGTCGNITISGGTVTATGGYGGAGIGGGSEGTCGNITISGGNVDATGGQYAAGIGGGYENYACGTITITSGVTSVTATKGSGAPNNIGKGNDGEDITVTIDAGANVTATGHALSASAVGEIVGSDGKAYAASDKNNLPSGVTVAGLVAYKNGNNGLAIALHDEPSTMSWDYAMGESGAKAHTPAVTGQTWKLPSSDDIVKMLSSYDSYWGDLNGAIVNVGGTGLLDGPQNSYWLSDVSDEDEDEARYMRDLSDEPTTVTKGQTYLVRSVIAF